MKYILICLLIFSIVGFRSERFYHFSLKETQAQFHWQNLENIKYALDNSTMPHQQVKQIISAIDTLQRDLQRGLRIDTIAPGQPN
ncbi:MAG: hypothetical protein ACK4YH_09250 [Bacteroidota bacterium]|jgi:hypothetical protein